MYGHPFGMWFTHSTETGAHTVPDNEVNKPDTGLASMKLVVYTGSQ